MIAVLRDQHLRQKSLGGKAALDQSGRRRRLHHPAPLALVAGVAGAHGLDDGELRRLIVQPLAAVLADLRHLAAAAGAHDRVRLDHLLAPVDLGPEAHPAARPPGRAPPALAASPLVLLLVICLGPTAGFSDRRPKLLERKLALVLAELLGARTEQRLPELLVEMLKPADLLRALRVLGLQPCRPRFRRLPRRLRRAACLLRFA